MAVLLGCIADDFTGATDVASMFAQAGLTTLQVIGAAPPPLPSPEQAQALVVALKSRTADRDDAVRDSLAALHWLREQGAERVYFKYCSTFDSTPQGNIGPVLEALQDAVGAPFTITTPAYPAQRRTVYQGHLFVGSELLAETGMRHHPLTPMMDSNLVRLLRPQCTRPVGLLAAVRRDARLLAASAAELTDRGCRIAIADAVEDDDLAVLAEAFEGHKLLAGASGLARAVASRLGSPVCGGVMPAPPHDALGAIIAGSCSEATAKQVQVHLKAGRPGYRIEAPQSVSDADNAVAPALRWADSQASEGAPLLFYSTAPTPEVRAVQGRLGATVSGALVERVLAGIAVGLVGRGVRRLLVAGGETSGACVSALGVKVLRIGPSVVPGVPWCQARAHVPSAADVHLCLKSGNFGGADFFQCAFDMHDAAKSNLSRDAH